MKKILALYLGLVITSIVFAQDKKRQYDLQPYATGIYTGLENMIEAGPELSWKQSIWGQSILLRPLFRVPIGITNENSVCADRYSPTWRAGMAFEYGIINNVGCTERNGHSFVLQAETGYSPFEYYPTSDRNLLSKDYLLSYAFELKFIGFLSSKQINSRQISPQLRIRYSRNTTPSDEIGIINGPLITDLIVDKPYTVSLISPAATIIYFPGTGIYSYGASIYYDYAKYNGSTSEYTSGRVRIEADIFCSPQIRMNYFKFGISPFISLRTNGIDKFKSILLGGQISVRFGTSFLQKL